MKHGEHHKKMNSVIPAWLWFAIYNSVPPTQKWNEEKEKIALDIKKHLKEHLRQHDLQNDIITEPNNYDADGMYGKCPCPDCCNVKLE